jgi:hypothetical protein
VSRRANGLSADAYTPLIDLAPELADTMLTALREAGIAAYAADGEIAEPDGSLDRLYVDATMEATAEGILHDHLARLREQRSGSANGPATGLPEVTGSDGTGSGTGAATVERDEDAIWADIVASFDTAPEDGVTPWPDEENVDPEAEPEGHDREGRLPSARLIKSADLDEPAGLDQSADSSEDDEGHYIPPIPPPLPNGDMVSRGAWVALIGGPLYLLFTVILGWEVPGWAAFTAVAAFIGGFVALVLRMGDDPRDSDDGAVI